MPQKDLNDMYFTNTSKGAKNNTQQQNNANHLEDTKHLLKPFNQELSAKKVLVKHILNARFIKEPNKPSIAETDLGLVKRVNIIGIVVFKDHSTIVVDDSTGSIVIRFLPEHQLKKASLGSCVQVIGRLRQSLKENYISGEFLTVVSKSWLNHRLSLLKSVTEQSVQSVTNQIGQLKIEQSKPEQSAEQLKIEESFEQQKPEKPKLEKPKAIAEKPFAEPKFKTSHDFNETPKNKSLELQILDIISLIDTGPGVRVEDIRQSLISRGVKFKELEAVLHHMIEKGLIFEVKPGLLKSL